MATVNIVLRRDKLNKKGFAPIHFRIIKNRKIRYISSGIMIEERLWSDKKKGVKPSHPNSKRFNSYLSNKYVELQDQVYEFETNTKSLTTAQLKNKIMGKKPVSIFDFAEDVLKEYLAAKKIGTYDKNKSILKKLKGYSKSNDLDFQDITPGYLYKYEQYMRDKLGNGIGTIGNTMKFIRKLFNEAIRQELIEAHLNPFTKFNIKTEKTKRAFLTEQELGLLEHLQLTKWSQLDLHRDMFVFASYAGGPRISDMLTLKWNQLDSTHIHYEIIKTGAQVSVKSPTKARAILQKYQQHPKKQSTFIFPILMENIDMNNAVLVDAKISSATAATNRDLKKLAKKIGTNKTLSFHIARHTWATLALKKGISIDKVSKILGHTNIRETQIYAKIVSKELDDAMDLFE